MLKAPFDLIIQNFDRPGASELDAFKQLVKYDSGQNVALMCGVDVPRFAINAQTFFLSCDCLAHFIGNRLVSPL